MRGICLFFFGEKSHNRICQNGFLHRKKPIGKNCQGNCNDKSEVEEPGINQPIPNKKDISGIEKCVGYEKGRDSKLNKKICQQTPNKNPCQKWVPILYF